MPILQEFRRLIRRRRGARRDPLTGANGTPATLGNDPLDLALVEPKLSVSAHEQDEARAELLALGHRIGDHLDGQSERTDRLIGFIEQLPESLKPLPEINRQNTRLLDVLTDHLGQVRNREDAISSALMRLSEVAEQQNRSLGQVEEQLDASCRMTAQMTDALGGFRQTLGELGRTNDQTVAVLSDISRAIETRENRLAATLGKSQTWMIVSVVCCTVLGAVALTIAVIAIAG